MVCFRVTILTDLVEFVRDSKKNDFLIFFLKYEKSLQSVTNKPRCVQHFEHDL